MGRSYGVQVREGMDRLPAQGKARKYCGAGWGGYAVYLFAAERDRDRFTSSKPDAVAVEPYDRWRGNVPGAVSDRAGSRAGCAGV